MAVIIGDYKYDNFVLGTCTIEVADKTKTSYSNVPSQITYQGQTYSVRSLKSCFDGCSNLVTPPSLPPEVGSMEFCFYGCSSMTTPPVIPNGVNNLSYCFYGCSSMATAPDLSPTTTSTTYPLNLNNCFSGCSSITQAPTIPSHTTNMNGCFRDTSIGTAPAIPASVTTMVECFRDCTALTTPPDLTSATSVTDMTYCFRGCSSLTSPPVIPSTAQYLEGTFLYCSALETAPAIPASATRVRACFSGCSAIAGNVKVYDSGMSEYNRQNVFAGTGNDIYIINGAGTSAVETTWKTIASGYSNVHYEADDNQIPALSFTATRVSGMASEVPSENGEYAFINATAIVYETYLPDGWSCAYDAGEEDITKDGTTQSPYWTRTNTGNVWTLKCWFSLGDTTKHTFTLQVADEITDENDNIKASQLSAIITQIIPKAYKLVDYYHDPNTDTEGMSIGKFATNADLFDVDMPALFRDSAQRTDMTTQEVNAFVAGLNISGIGNTPVIVGANFGITITDKTTGSKTASTTITVPPGYYVVQNCRPISLYISGDAYVTVTDRSHITVNGNTISFTYYLNNPQGRTSNMTLNGTVLCCRSF